MESLSLSSSDPIILRLDEEYKSVCILNGDESIQTASILTKYG